MAGPLPLGMTRPPPARLSTFGYIQTARKDYLASFTEACYEQEFVHRRVLGRPSVVVNAPEAIQQILVDRAPNYIKAKVLHRLLEPAFGNGVVTTEGETWQAQRHRIAPIFQPRNLGRWQEPISGALGEMFSRWEDSTPRDGTLDFGEEARRLTLNIMCRGLLDVTGADLEAKINAAVADYQRSFGGIGLVDILGLPAWLPSRAASRAKRAVRELDRAIAELVGIGERAPGISRALYGWDGHAVSAADLSLSRETRDELTTLLLAGQDTTAVALVWALYLLALHPAAQDEIRRETIPVFGDAGPAIEWFDRLPYTRAVIDETLRLFPPAYALLREVVADDVVCGQTLRRGSTVIISPWVLHRHRLLWDRPGQFRPERFSREGALGRHRCAFIPFGAGPRVCVGARLAMIELVLIVASIIHRYRIGLAHGETMAPVALVTLWPREALLLKLESADRPPPQ